MNQYTITLSSTIYLYIVPETTLSTAGTTQVTTERSTEATTTLVTESTSKPLTTGKNH
jgi:hypothetical protein